MATTAAATQPVEKKRDPVREGDTGLKILREAPDEADAIDIVAVHGLAAHPKYTWVKKDVDDEGVRRDVNWLEHPDMLPKLAPKARIMAYGYMSNWYGKGAMNVDLGSIAQRLLDLLNLRREDCPDRPLIFIVHCYGGLVLIKALIEAVMYPSEAPGISKSTAGIVFLATPFRGAEGLDQATLLSRIYEDETQDKVQASALDVIQPHSQYLQSLLSDFCRGFMSTSEGQTQVLCFFEEKSSDVWGTTKYAVTKDSACLDPGRQIKTRGLARDHYAMNKFGLGGGGDWYVLSGMLQRMIKNAAAVVKQRSESDYDAKVAKTLKSTESAAPVGKRGNTVNNHGDWHVNTTGGRNIMGSNISGETINFDQSDHSVDNHRVDNRRFDNRRVDRSTRNNTYTQNMRDVQGMVVGHMSGGSRINTNGSRAPRGQSGFDDFGSDFDTDSS